MNDHQIDIQRSRPPRRKIGWHCVLISENGKIVYLEKYRSIAIFAVIFWVVSSVFSLGVLYFFQKNRMENRSLRKALQASEQRVKSLESDTRLLTARLVLAGIDPGLERNHPEAPADQTVQGAKLSETPERDKIWPDKSSLVSISDFAAFADSKNNHFHLQFRLNNISNHRISGYLFIILKDGSESSGKWLSVPGGDFENGVPSNHESGRKFSILNFKVIEFRTEQKKMPGSVSEAVVFVFGTDGDRMLRKVFPVTI